MNEQNKQVKLSDLTIGNPFTKILIFSIPIIIGNIFQQVYSLVDAFIVSNYSSGGTDAFTGLGLAAMPLNLVTFFSFGLTQGFSIVTAQFFGAKDHKNVKKSVANSFLICLVLSILMPMILVPTLGPLLNLLNIHDAHYQYAYDYLLIIFLLMITFVLYNYFSNLLRSIGDSRTPLIFLILSCLLNVGLDMLFVHKDILNMGVAGAAYATVISQSLSVILCVVYTFKKYEFFRFGLKDLKPDFEIVKKELAVGLPMALQTIIITIGVMFVTSVVNNIDKSNDNYSAAFTISSKVDAIATQVVMATGVAMSVYVGQNYGAKKFDRIKQGIIYSIIITTAFTVVSFVFMLVFSDSMVDFLLGTLEEGKSYNYQFIHELTFLYFLVNGIFYFVLGMLSILRNTVQGFGRGDLVVVSSAVQLGTRILIAMLTGVFSWGWNGVVFCAPIAWFVSDIALIFLAKYSYKKALEKNKK